MTQLTHLIRALVAKNGPDPSDYPALDAWFSRVHELFQEKQLSKADITSLQHAFAEAMTPLTLQGFVVHKPHGYAGDFEIIDRIYTGYVSSDQHLSAWDYYFHRHAAPKAVRNRKDYFQEVMDCHFGRRRSFRVLDVGCGSGRCVHEWLAAHSDAEIDFHCVDLDLEAVRYASHLNREFLDRATFVHQDALRFKTTAQHFDLIWCAGLCDYLTDLSFRSLLRRLLSCLEPAGELIIANFSDRNPSRAYMEFGGWYLHHRSADQLRQLAYAVGVSPSCVRVASEPEGVNLFMHITSELPSNSKALH